MNSSKIIVISLLLLLSCSSNRTALSAADKEMSILSQTRKYDALKPIGKKGQEIVLASNRKTQYAILIPKKPTVQDQTAAGILQKWLGKMSQAEFSIVKEGSARVTKVISIGNTQMLKAKGVNPSSYVLGTQGYAIVQKAENLFLLGGTMRGPINAVLALLEEDLGCRWYSIREGTYIPKRPSLRFQPTSRSEQPAFEIRYPYYREVANRSYAVSNRLNPMTDEEKIPKSHGGQYHTAKGWGGHTFKNLVNRKTYFASHPEYFAYLEKKKARVKNGQLCMTNASVFEISKNVVLKTLKENPGINYISIGQSDGFGLTCQCEKCKAINDREGAQSGTLILFLNQLSKVVEQKYPNIQLFTLAYRETAKPPKTKPRKNVSIRLCTDAHAWRNLFQTIDKSPVFMSNLKGWKALTDNVHIWDYTIDFNHYLSPLPNMQVVAANTKIYQQNKVKGLYYQAFLANWSPERSEMRAWVFSKLMWNPQRDVEALMRDFIEGYYGNAAPKIQEYNDLLTNGWKANGQQKGKKIDPLLGPNFGKDALRIFDEAALLAENDLIKTRVEQAKVPVLYHLSRSQPKTKTEAISTQKNLKEFEQLAVKHKQTVLKVNADNKIDDFLLSNKAKLEAVKSSKTGLVAKNPNLWYGEEIDFKLGKIPKYKDINPKIIDDPLAENKYAIEIPVGNSRCSTSL